MTSSPAKMASTVTVVRGKRGRPHSSAKAARKRIVSTSAMPTAPATSQWTFSQVTQNRVARKSVPVTFMCTLVQQVTLCYLLAVPLVPRGTEKVTLCYLRTAEWWDLGSFETHEELRQLLHACPATESLPILRGERRAVERPCRPAGVELGEGRRQGRDVVGRRDDASAHLPDQLGGGALGRHGGEDRPLGGDVLEDLPREHAPAAAPGLRDQQQQRVRVALQRERLAPRHVRVELEARAESERLRPLAVGDAEVADEARDDVLEAGLRERGQERTRIALPEKAPGMRDAEAIAAPVLEAGEVVEVGAVQDRRDEADGLERTRFVRDGVGRRHDHVCAPRDETRDRLTHLLLRPHRRAF